MIAFFEYPLRSIEATLANVEKSVRTLPADQLRQEMAQLKDLAKRPDGEWAAALLAPYGRELTRRGHV